MVSNIRMNGFERTITDIGLSFPIVAMTIKIYNSIKKRTVKNRLVKFEEKVDERFDAIEKRIENKFDEVYRLLLSRN